MAIRLDELLEALDPSLDKFEEDLDSMWIIIPTERRYDDLTADDYFKFSKKYGTFHNRKDCFDKIAELAPDRWDAFIPMKLEGVNEAYETDIEIESKPGDPYYTGNYGVKAKPGDPYYTGDKIGSKSEDPYFESLNEDINSDFLPKDIKLINRELERNDREVSKLGFSTQLLADKGLISVYVPDKTYNFLVKEIVNETAKDFGYKSELENESSTGDILFSFHRADDYGKTFRSKEVENSKQWFEDTIKTYGIDYETALAIILDEIDNNELDFITKEIIRRMDSQ